MRHFTFPTVIAADLVQVDALIRDRLASQQAVLQAAGQFLLQAGNHRLRAALTLLAAHTGEHVDQRVLHAAAAVELIQNATQAHGALIDEAVRRKAGALLDERWANDVALMIGDYLFALAASEMSLAPDPRILDYFSRAVMTISEGKLTPVLVTAPFAPAREQYMATIGAKTAALFAAACKAGMVCGGGTNEMVERLGRFGYALGLCYAITNDLADLTNGGSQLRAGTITLPLIYAVEAGADARVAGIIDQSTADDAEINSVVAEIIRVGGGLRAYADAEALAQQALAELAPLTASAARTGLESLAHAVITHSNA